MNLKAFHLLILFSLQLSFFVGCAHYSTENINREPAAKSKPADFGLPPGIVGILNAEQLLISRNLDERKIFSPKANSQDNFYKPENQNVFEIKTYWINEADLDAFTTTNVDPKLKGIMYREVNGVKQWRLIVHPESENFYKNITDKGSRAKNFLATATSSSRTLVVWPEGKPELAFFGKLSLDSEIAGVVRTIFGAEIARSVGTSELLDTISADLPSSFKYFPESIGIMPKGQEKGGMIIREIPADIKSGEKKFLPLFSLYGECEKCGKKPLLIDMINRSGMPADKFITEKIISPFLDQWID
ncbi:MAG: IucA/IucC family protein, partial [Bdellovibrionales bacterium]|nr:IucA/IucC family protein [Bdellovibrionales bacterium]